MGKLGVEKLQAAILLAVAFFNQGKQSSEDGVQASDIFAFIDEAMQIQGVLATGAEIKAELDDLDMTERQGIIDAVGKNLDIASEKAEQVVLDAIDWVAASYKMARNLVS